MKFNDLFDTKSKFYSKYRPQYANEFIAYLNNNYFNDKNKIVADIGCGTGLLSKQILDCNMKVIGIEPNKEMLNKALTYLKDYANFTSINATAENTTLKDNSIDIITVGQAFHWFELDQFKKESLRILKKDGLVVLVWNRKCKGNMENNRKVIVEKYRSIMDSYNCSWKEREEGINKFFNGDFLKLEFDNPLIETWEEFIGRTLSASHAINISDERIEEYINEWKIFFDKYKKDGKVTTRNKTIAFIGKIK